MKLQNKAIDKLAPSSLESQILAYQFAAEQAKLFEARRQELSEAIKAQLPKNEVVKIGAFEVRVSEYNERRFMAMAEAEKIVGAQIIGLIVNQVTKQRLSIK